MYSLSLYPVITRPTRITAHCATLIDNIFTNNLNTNITSGLFVNDITDHLPIFITFETRIYNKSRSKTAIKNVRLRSDCSVNAFNQSLSEQNWDNVLAENDVNKAYNNIVDTFKHLQYMINTAL